MGGYVILAPHRESRPDDSKGFMPVCPFCIGNEETEKEVFRIGGKPPDDNWQVRVLPNKFPFAPIHEIFVHSPDHHKNFDELPLQQVETIFEAFQERYNKHAGKGTVFIFSNHGELGGESLPHPHSQLVVLPPDVSFELPRLEDVMSETKRTHPGSGHPSAGGDLSSMFRAGGGFLYKNEKLPYYNHVEMHETKNFILFCPQASQWPDEVWVAPKQMNKTFGEISVEERNNLSFILYRLIQIFTVKHGHEFPFNFYIYPKENWYLRFIPRDKKMGGIEIVSNVFVNTGNPEETMEFIRENF